jgi:N-acyl-D-glutamate deacylase
MTEPRLDRRTLLALAAGAAVTPRLAVAQQAVALRPNLPGPYDLVITGGRAIDPETGLDAVRNIGVIGGRIAAISEQPLEGAKTIDAEGHIVAPGCIDLHAHGQQMAAAWVQAYDGVTTALELESGLLPISMFYDITAKEGRPINYGAGAAWTYARVEAKEGIKPNGTIGWFQDAFSLSNWQNTLATTEELELIMDRVDAGLREGGLGVSINAGYAPGYGRKEYYELAKLAAKHNVATFTHVRYLNAQEPLSSFEAIEELLALSAITGAHMHLCHLNSSSVGDIEDTSKLVQEAIDRGLRVTTEAYPYGAGSSVIGAEVFRGDDWLQRWGVPDASRMETNGKALSQKEITELQESAPGTIVVMHFLKPEDSERDRDLLDKSVLFPGGAIASDAMPWTDSKGALISEPDVWPLPEGAFAHPRTSGCYSRFLAEFVRKRNAISLSDGLAKCSLIPANIMAESVPQMRTKGRLQVGMDADLMIFDLEKVQDNATFQEPAKLSSGHRHIVVNGVAVIEEGERMPDRLAGRAIRRKV